MLIPKNTSVLVRRVPGRPRMPIVTDPKYYLKTFILLKLWLKMFQLPASIYSYFQNLVDFAVLTIVSYVEYIKQCYLDKRFLSIVWSSLYLWVKYNAFDLTTFGLQANRWR